MKSRFLKRASVVTLSAVMACGVAFAAASCGGGGGDKLNGEGYLSGVPGQSKSAGANALTVFIFCNKSDTATNQQICDQWAAEYNTAHGTNISVKLTTQTDKNKYFDEVNSAWSDNDMYDVFYLAPRYVRTYADSGRALNIADYIDTVSAVPSSTTAEKAKADNEDAFGNVWQNALSYYAYQKGKKDTYTLGQTVHYNSDEGGFYIGNSVSSADNANTEVGLYALPKDYSTFVTGINRKLFSDDIKEAVTTTLPTAERTVLAPRGEGNYAPGQASNEEIVSQKGNYTGASGRGPLISLGRYHTVSEYAVDVTDASGNVIHHAGDPAPLINPGIPTTYYPYNFFRFSTYAEAKAAGDPLVVLGEQFMTDDNGNLTGYTVTIPGFPDETFKIPAGTATDPNAPYDTAIGHYTYTYSEYSAMVWAMTFYLNTFAWHPQADGYGGVPVQEGTQTVHYVVYGGDQYEGINGASGSVLYLLPWLYGNDADFIDTASQYCINFQTNEDGSRGLAIPMRSGETATSIPDLAISNPEDWRDVAGKYTEKVTKLNLDGTTRQALVESGFNSENFIETYGAFLAHATDWNANAYGDTSAASRANNGWAYFRAGRCLFYGAGSWDAATRNESDFDVLEAGQMPTPVSDRYSLYSRVKGANYEQVVYSNGVTTKGTGDAVFNEKDQRTNLNEGLKVYSESEIIANQLLRQDKWGARMDSVGYAVNGQVTNYTGDQAWKKEAAVSLAMALTIGRDGQATLTYAGAQYPNFMDQSVQFLKYQEPEYQETGAFKDMITPDGSATVKNTETSNAGTELWNRYYEVAKQMANYAINALRGTSGYQSSMTVSAFLADKNVKYDEYYKDTTLASFVGEGDSRLAFSMKVLRMVPFSYADRELNLRMQYGLNAVRDSTMYTFNELWLGKHDARDHLNDMLAYRYQMPFSEDLGDKWDEATGYSIKANLVWNPADASTDKRFITPAYMCFYYANSAHTELRKAVADENV